jgi:hypothetical protein
MSDQVSDDGEPAERNLDLVQTRTSVHELETQLAYLKLRLRTGELLDKAKVQGQLATIGRRHRDVLLALPVRHAYDLASKYGVSGRDMLACLDRIIHQELREMAAIARARRNPP